MSLLSSAMKMGRGAAWMGRQALGPVPPMRQMAAGGLRIAESGARASLQFGAAAGAAAMGVGVAGYGLAKGVGMGRIFTQKDGLPRLMGTLQAAMVGVPMGVGAGMGVRNEFTQRKGGWGISQSPGMPLEMERSDFMGATGSLALSSRPRQSWSGAAADSLNFNWSRYGAVYADDAAHLLVAAFHH